MAAIWLAAIVCVAIIAGGTALAGNLLTGFPKDNGSLLWCLRQAPKAADADMCDAARQSIRVTFWILLCGSWWPAQVAYRAVMRASGSPGRRDGPAPLFAIASLPPAPSSIHHSSAQLTRTVLIPFGVARPAVGTGIALGGLVAIAFTGHAPIDFVNDAIAMAGFIAVFVAIALLPAYLVACSETMSPLDDYLRQTSRTARPTLEDSVGLIPVRDSWFGQQFPGLFAPDRDDAPFATLVTFAMGTWYGMATTGLRPHRLISLVYVRRNGHQREALCYGVGRVLIGRPVSDLDPQLLTHNPRFLSLYFGHALSSFAGLMVAIMALVSANYVNPNVHYGNPMHVLADAVLLWWGTVILYAFSVCASDVAMLREDLEYTLLSPYVPTSLRDRHPVEPLLGLFDVASTRWIPKTVGVASSIMLVAALAAIQAWEAGP